MIVGKPREAGVRLSQGPSVAEVVRVLAVGEGCHRVRKEYGGVRVEQAKRLKIERPGAPVSPAHHLLSHRSACFRPVFIVGSARLRRKRVGVNG